MFSRDCTNRKLPEIDGNEVAFINYSKKKNLYENTLPKLRQDRIAAAVCFQRLKTGKDKSTFLQMNAPS